AALWYFVLHEDAIVLAMCPIWTQVERILLPEIWKLASLSLIRLPPPTATSLRHGPKHFILGLSTNEGVRIQGYHSEHILIILDEAPGISAEIWEAIEGIRAGGEVCVLALGNPVVASGPFYDAFASNRCGWYTITISAFDTPNLAGITLERLLELDDA